MAAASAAATTSNNVKVLFCGNMNYDSLGNKTYDAATDLAATPRLVPLPDNIEQVFAGSQGAHFFAVGNGGKDVWAWGKNSDGQLGLGSTKTVLKPTQVSLPLEESDTVKQIACGKRHTLFLLSSGKVFGAGKNEYGQLGIGRTSDQETKPVALKETSFASPVRYVSCGVDFSLALCLDGTLYSFGYPANGRLGLGSDGSYNSSGSSIKMVYEKNSKPAVVPGKFSLVRAGASHVVASSADGVLMTWGEGSYGRLGNGKLSNNDSTSPTPVDDSEFGRQKSPPANVFAGKTYSCAVLANTSIVLWGRLRTTSEVQNRPKIDYGYSGQGTITDVAFSGDGFVFLAGGAACAMGTGSHKQLALGAKGSTSKPDYCAALDDLTVKQVAGGAEAILYAVPTDAATLAAIAKFPPINTEPTSSSAKSDDESDGGAAAGKKGAKGKKAAAKRKEAASEDTEEDEEESSSEEEDDDDSDSDARSKSKKGKGKAKPKAKSTKKPAAAKKTKRS